MYVPDPNLWRFVDLYETVQFCFGKIDYKSLLKMFGL